MHDASPALLPPPADPAPGAISLFLDFDGTLVDIAERHDQVVASDALRALIARLAAALAGRLAIVSGRTADEIVTYLHAADSQPPFAIAGSHGLELRWTDGRDEAPRRPATLDTAMAELHALADVHPGVVVEDKPFGATLHYRRAPDAGQACDALTEQLAERFGFLLQRGKMVSEIRLPGGDKGDAVRRFMTEPPFAGSTPIFLGDDVTDEAGFAAAAALGGWGVQIGDKAVTAAAYELPDVAAVHRWLGAIAEQAA